MKLLLNILSEYKYSLANWLINNKNCEVYIPILKSFYGDKEINIKDQRIKQINVDSLISREYIEKYNINKLKDLDEFFLEKILQYENYGISINARQWNWPIGIYDEAKREFYFYLRYWNDFFDRNAIDCVIFDVVPHWPVFYPMYVVARIRGIRTFIIQAFGIRVPEIEGYICVYGDTIETLGDSVETAYNNIKNIDSSQIELSGLIKRYFEKSVAHDSEAAIMPNARGRWKKYVKKNKYAAAEVKNPEWKYITHNLKYFVSAILKYRDINRYKEKKYSIYDYANMKRCRLYTKYNAYSLKEYEKMAVDSDYSAKYIYFPLQLWPEASTLPQAGVFDDQISSIFLLSSITRDFGIKIYVKEYYLQPYRAKSFYNDLRKLENVCMIHSDVSSDELLSHAIAAASQTGTVLIEAPFYGIPSLTFGGGFGLKGMPGLFRIRDVKQGKEVISQILNGITISTDELKKYYYALHQNSIFFHRTPIGKVDVNSEWYKETVRDLKRVIETEVLNDRKTA